MANSIDQGLEEGPYRLGAVRLILPRQQQFLLTRPLELRVGFGCPQPQSISGRSSFSSSMTKIPPSRARSNQELPEIVGTDCSRCTERSSDIMAFWQRPYRSLRRRSECCEGERSLRALRAARGSPLPTPSAKLSAFLGEPASSWSAFYRHRRRPRIVVYRPFVRQRAVNTLAIVPYPHESSKHISSGDAVATLPIDRPHSIDFELAPEQVEKDN